MALLLGLLLGAAVIILILFVLYRVIGRNPYACLERRHGDETSATPASVLTTSNVADDNSNDDDDDDDDDDASLLYDSLSYKLVDAAQKKILHILAKDDLQCALVWVVEGRSSYIL